MEPTRLFCVLVGQFLFYSRESAYRCLHGFGGVFRIEFFFSILARQPLVNRESGSRICRKHGEFPPATALIFRKRENIGGERRFHGRLMSCLEST